MATSTIKNDLVNLGLTPYNNRCHIDGFTVQANQTKTFNVVIPNHYCVIFMGRGGNKLLASIAEGNVQYIEPWSDITITADYNGGTVTIKNNLGITAYSVMIYY